MISITEIQLEVTTKNIRRLIVNEIITKQDIINQISIPTTNELANILFDKQSGSAFKRSMFYDTLETTFNMFKKQLNDKSLDQSKIQHDYKTFIINVYVDWIK